MEISEMLNTRKTEYEQILESLIKSCPARFDQGLPVMLPKIHGLYAISMIGARSGEYLHAGKSCKGHNGLCGRIWDQHYKIGGSPGDLLEKIKARGHASGAIAAKEFISENCQVQWVVVEDAATRNWAEHYILAMLKPIWGS
jgi:hypothetical protein